MKKKLFYCIAAWYDETGFCVEHGYAATGSEAEAIGQFFQNLEAKTPQYKKGSNFVVKTTEISAATIRECI